MNRPAALLAAVLSATACGEADPAVRDYTAEACPTPLRPDPMPVTDVRSVCDRGRGYSPRFVTIEACMAELRLRPGAEGWGLRGSSPIYQRCWPAVLVYTLDDVRTAPGLVSY